MLLQAKNLLGRQFHVFKGFLWPGFDESFDDLEGKELIYATVSRF